MQIPSFSPARFAGNPAQPARPSAQTQHLAAPPSDSFVKFGAKSDWTRTEVPGEYIEYTHPDGGMSTWSESPYGFWLSQKKNTLVDKFSPSTSLYWLNLPERGGTPEAALKKAYEYLRDTYHATIAREAAEQALTIDIPRDFYRMSDAERRQTIKAMPQETFEAFYDAQAHIRYLFHVVNRQLREETIEFLQQDRFHDNPLVEQMLEVLREVEPPVHPEGIEWTPEFIAEFEAGLSREVQDFPEDASIFQEPGPAKIANWLQGRLEVYLDLKMDYQKDQGEGIQEDIEKIRQQDPALAEPLQALLDKWREGRFPDEN